MCVCIIAVSMWSISADGRVHLSDTPGEKLLSSVSWLQRHPYHLRRAFFELVAVSVFMLSVLWYDGLEWAEPI